jgi:hypothetical protein
MRRIFAAVLMGWVMVGGVRADVFDPASNTLSIPTLQIGSAVYENARLLLSPNGQWSVLNMGSRAAATTSTINSTGGVALTLTIAPTSIEAQVGEDVSVMVGGGIPPYTFYSSRSILAPISQFGNRASFTTYGVGKADVIITDSAGNQASVGVTITSKLEAAPTTLSAVVGEQLTIHFINGVPPYTVGTSNATIAKAGEVTYHAPLHGSATIYTYRAGNSSIMIHDAYGNMVSTTLTVTNTR